MTGHLIHIGYPKTGSNFLRRWFAGHPQLDYAEGAIAGFRDVYQIVQRAAAPRERAPLYRVTSSEGFATPHPSFGESLVDHTRREMPMEEAQAAACDLLADLFPNAKVLIVTRGFRSAIPSIYSQAVRAGASADFATFCAHLEDAVRTNIDGWNYCALFGMYRERFGDANVIVMPYELLRDDPETFTAAIEARLGLQHFTPPTERVNASLSPVELYWYPRLSRAVRKIGSDRVLARYARAALVNGLRVPIRILQRLRPGTPANLGDIPEGLVEAYRGRADCLRDHPLYARYASDYLW